MTLLRCYADVSTRLLPPRRMSSARAATTSPSSRPPRHFALCVFERESSLARLMNMPMISPAERRRWSWRRLGQKPSGEPSNEVLSFPSLSPASLRATSSMTRACSPTPSTTRMTRRLTRSGRRWTTTWTRAGGAPSCCQRLCFLLALSNPLPEPATPLPAAPSARGCRLGGLGKPGQRSLRSAPNRQPATDRRRIVADTARNPSSPHLNPAGSSARSARRRRWRSSGRSTPRSPSSSPT